MVKTISTVEIAVKDKGTSLMNTKLASRLITKAEHNGASEFIYVTFTFSKLKAFKYKRVTA